MVFLKLTVQTVRNDTKQTIAIRRVDKKYTMTIYRRNGLLLSRSISKYFFVIAERLLNW